MIRFSEHILITELTQGNIWTEILQLLEQDQPLFMIIYIETFFTTFYMTFFLVQKSFAVLLIAKFIHRVGDTASILPGEQIHQFRNLWRKMRRGKNQKTMAFKILPLFLSKLKVHKCIIHFSAVFFVRAKSCFLNCSHLSALKDQEIITTPGTNILT